MPESQTRNDPMRPQTHRLLRGFRRWTVDFHNRTVLFRVGNWVVTTYAFLAGLAFATGLGVTLWYDALIGLDLSQMVALYVLVLGPAVLIGLRAFSILLEWRALLQRPLQTVIKPGYMLHGGIAGGALAFLYISHLTGVPLLRLLDGPALALPLGEAIARLGCYVYGCCWGAPTQSRLGVCYTSAESKVVRCAPHLRGKRIHPAQLYALGIYLALFLVFLALLPVLPFDGALAGAYLISHSILRIALERFRQDDRGRLWGPLTHTNLYAGLMILAGIAMLWVGSGVGTSMRFDGALAGAAVEAVFGVLPWIVSFGIAFGAVYGVHYKQVGAWIVSSTSEDEVPGRLETGLSMGMSSGR